MKIIPWILVALGTASIIAGRIVTIDMTGGRALIAGWPYWAVSVMCFLCVLWRSDK